MLGAFPGDPCSKTTQCQAITNAKLLKYIETRSVAPLGRVTGLTPALDALQAALQDVSAANATLYSLLGTAGMLCCRLIRNSYTSFSNHAWGAAIDIKVNGIIDTFEDGYVSWGLIWLAPFMQAHGFYWGAGLSNEDGMHFEIANQVMQGWISSGMFSGTYTTNPPRYPLCSSGNYYPTLQQGATGADVKSLQALLNYWGYSTTLTVDGSFGSGTKAAVVSFQSGVGITFDGIVGPGTWGKLFPASLSLTYGDSGWAVHAVKERMRSTLGYTLLSAPAGASTTYDSALETAIEDYQGDRYFLQDGTVTNVLWEAMMSNCVNAAAYSAQPVTAGLIDTDATDSANVNTLSAVVMLLILSLLALLF